MAGKKGNMEMDQKSAIPNKETSKSRIKRKSLAVALAAAKLKEDENWKNLRQSDKVIKSFEPLKIFLAVYGRLPFSFKRRDDGTPYLHFSPVHLGWIYFLISSIIAILIFVLMLTGFVTLFLRINQSPMLNKCNFTWETWELGKYCVLVSLGFTWLCLTVIGSIFLFKYGHAYVHYFNYWLKAVEVMDMDVTQGAKRGIIIGHLLMGLMVLIFVVLYMWGIVPSVNEGSGSLANAMVRLFDRDIFWTPPQQEREVRVRNQRTPGAEPPDEHVYEHCGLFRDDFDSYDAYKLFGFIVQIYSIIGSRIFISQFRFFARLLRNAAVVWNARLKNAFEECEEDLSDQTKRRMEFKLLLKDHLILAQLFRMTETCFALIVQSFYFIQVVNVGFQLYFFSQLGTIDTCTQYYNDLKSSNLEKCKIILQGLQGVGDQKQTIDFDDAICGDIEDSQFPNAMIALVLFFQTVLLFHTTTGSAADAYEQAMEGFAIVRRHGFMLTKSRRERNFIHCMVVSFARNNPMVLSAAGYFIVSRALTLVVIATVVNYFIILLQFKPGNVPACSTT